MPMIVRWPGKIKAGSESDFPWYFPDVLPTLAQLAGVEKEVPEAVDGISIVPTLTGKGKQAQRDYLYWQFGPQSQAVRSGKWKLLADGTRLLLFDLSEDMGERNNLAATNPETVQRLKGYMNEAFVEPRSQEDDGKYTGRPEARNPSKKAKK